MFDKLDDVVKRYEKLTEKLVNPTVYENQKDFKQISSERAGLEDIVTTYGEYKKLQEDVNEAKQILKDEKDEDVREMAKEILDEGQSRFPSLEEKLKILLLPKDPLDEKNVMIEIRAGAGGNEASIFAADLFRMYQNYCRSIHFKTELISLSKNAEGIKEAILSVSGKKVYSRLKYESGVHRVQRVPKTESQGRIHTSTVTVAVMPEADGIDFRLNMNDVKVDVFRASGAGGQHINTTDSAVRLTHLPTGIIVTNQDQKSQIKNKDKAMKILSARIYDQMIQQKKIKEDANRKGQIGTGDRSERIRTYNYPQGRLTDHRIGLTRYNLDNIMEGNFGEVNDALVAYNQAELLKGEKN